MLLNVFYPFPLSSLLLRSCWLVLKSLSKYSPSASGCRRVGPSDQSGALGCLWDWRHRQGILCAEPMRSSTWQAELINRAAALEKKEKTKTGSNRVTLPQVHVPANDQQIRRESTKLLAWHFGWVQNDQWFLCYSRKLKCVPISSYVPFFLMKQFWLNIKIIIYSDIFANMFNKAVSTIIL